MKIAFASVYFSILGRGFLILKKGCRGMIYKNIAEVIGRTPVIRLGMTAEDMAEIFLKVESFNPGGSIKDRASLFMIRDAEARGVLKEGQVIIEATSGNTGISLAMLGASMGYKVIIVMPETMSQERRSLIASYGAELILTSGALGMKGSVEKAKELAVEKGYLMPSQFTNPSNVTAHIETTAVEIWEDFGDSLDAFVAGVGSGGTITGVAKVLKSRNPKILITAVQPEKSPVLTGGVPSGHGIQGIGANFVPEILELSFIDRIIDMSESEAFQGARYLAEEAGILSGISSGANLAAAIRIARELGKGKKVLTILPDTGERYLSTDLYRKD